MDPRELTNPIACDALIADFTETDLEELVVCLASQDSAKPIGFGLFHCLELCVRFSWEILYKALEI